MYNPDYPTPKAGSLRQYPTVLRSQKPNSTAVGYPDSDDRKCGGTVQYRTMYYLLLLTGTAAVMTG
jgi:hypothetical protein